MSASKSVSRRHAAPGHAAWLVYVLCCRDGSLYTGITNDLTRRLATHAAGKASRYTRSRLPVRLAYQERQPTKSRALQREAAIKSLSRAEKLRLLEGRVARHPAAAEPSARAAAGRLVSGPARPRPRP